ncbi:CBY1-interacting BAR domain-containing protein 1-A-like [Tubulanus polymorphus]|uniref:CBY1-interacting BAR domain-containing protein 1-A-like n=1 Tax=Tubulanus polymorphus TaxID=672921 RepID=UPI003DA67ACD
MKMNRSNAEIRQSESQSKFIQNRISMVEKHFGLLCDSFGAYARKSARLRDKADDVSTQVQSYAESETLNHTYKSALTKFSEYLSSVQDYRQAEISRLEAKVIQPLTLYGTACKHAREDLKASFSARGRETKQQKTLEKVKDKNPSDRGSIAEKELQKAGVDAARSTKALEEQMDSFERRKLKDLKQILYDFVNVEMIFHAKALEALTQCYSSLSIMSEEEDLEEFRNSLRPLGSSTRLNNMHRTSSRSSLNSAGQSSRPTPPTTPRRRRPPKSNHTTSVTTSSSRNHTGSSSLNHTSARNHHHTSKNSSTRTKKVPQVNHNHYTNHIEDDDDDDEDDDDDDDIDDEDEDDESYSKYRR